MARPYSMDLRERAVVRVQAGESVRVVARALSLSPSSVVKWSQRFRATGSAAAGKMGGHRPRLLVGAHAAFLWERIAARGLHLAWSCGGTCRPWSQVRLLDGLELRPSRRAELQKKPSCQASKTGLTSPASGRAGKPIKGRSIRGGSSSSMRLGPRRTWRLCADGVCEEQGSRPRRLMATGRR
jgi:hypothetical protein